jgi:EAL domain-containing protein (putative c-di-GMP-specific phosphodiesterase class I)
VAGAERAGLIRDLTRWVLRTAFRESATWPAAPDGEDINVALNISAAQLADDLIVSDVRDALRAAGVPANRVVLEVTETAEVVDLECAKRTLGALADLGVGLALDDFGTGFSSLTHIQVLPFDILKVDRSFVAAAAAGDRRAIATIAAVCALAARIQVDVVAEGVEDQGQLAELIALGCNHAQGYALARPLPPAQIAEALAGQGDAGWVLSRQVDPSPTLTAVPVAVPGARRPDDVAEQVGHAS